MSYLSTARSIQIGYLDNDAHEIIELIQHYPFPADFIRWLTDGRFTFKILQERMHDGKYTRIAQYYADDILVFTGRFEYDLNKASKETVQFLTKKRSPMDASMPEASHFVKHPITSVAVDLHYTTVCSFQIKGETVGFAWGIFELPQIIHLYSKMNDPLRHWRKS